MTATTLAQEQTGAVREVSRSTRSGAVGLLGAAASGAFGFALAVVITRGYGVAGAGALFTSIGIITVIGAVCALGADTGLIWALPRRCMGVGGDAARLLPVSVLPPTALAIVIGVAGAVNASALAGLVFDDVAAGSVGLVRVTFLALPAAVVMTILLSAVRGARSIGSYVGVQFFLLPIGRPLAVGAAAIAGAGVVVGMAGWVAPVIVAVVVCLLLVWRPLGLRDWRALRTKAGDWRSFWGFALPRAASAAIDSSSMWVGVVITAAMASQQEAGVFGAVGRYVLAGLLALQGIRVAVAPQLSRLLASSDMDSVTAVHRQTTIWAIVLSWPVYLVLAVFSPAVLLIFGDEFTVGAGALSVLALVMLIKVGLGNVQTLLLMSGRSGIHLAAAASGLVVNVTGAVIFVPSHGVLGGAYAWAAGIAVESVLAAFAARRIVGGGLVSRGVWLTMAGTLGGVGALLVTAALLADRGPTGLALALTLMIIGVLVSLMVPPVRRAALGQWRILRGGARQRGQTA